MFGPCPAFIYYFNILPHGDLPPTPEFPKTRFIPLLGLNETGSKRRHNEPCHFVCARVRDESKVTFADRGK